MIILKAELKSTDCEDREATAHTACSAQIFSEVWGSVPGQQMQRGVNTGAVEGCKRRIMKPWVILD